MPDFKGYVAERFRHEPHAAEWDEYLDYRLRWSVADLGGVPIWDRPIPDRRDWWRIVDELNCKLARLERAEAGPGAVGPHPEEIPTPVDVRRVNLFE